jgi:hypothetical protein
MNRSNSEVQEIRHCKKWSRAEDLRLLRGVQARPQNLHHCFMMVAEELGRTEGAVANHWYTVVSKDPANLCLFTASPKHVSKNRKNGVGQETGNSIWRRLLNVIRNL